MKHLIVIIIIIIFTISIINPIIVIRKVNSIALKKVEVTGHATVGTVGLFLLKRVDLESLNLTAILLDDNESVMLIWNNISGNNFSIYMIENISDPFTYGVPNVSGITSLNWTDSDPSETRFYRLGVITEGVENVSLEIVGKMTIQIYAANQIPGEVEFNTISLPLRPANLSLDNVFRWSSVGDTMMTYNPMKAPDPGFDGAINFGGALGWFGDFENVNVSKSYWLGIVSAGYNLTIVGEVPQSNMTIHVFESNQIPGDIEFNTLGWHSALTLCNLSNLFSPSSSVGDTVMSYDPFKAPNPGFDGVIKFGAGLGWWGDFDCLEAGKGYTFGLVNSEYTWEYDPYE